MKLKMFTCIVDNGVDLDPVRVTGVATSEKDFKERYKGNGDLLKITEIETALTHENFMNGLKETLMKAGYGINEINLITAIIEENNK